jgi:hypothetical protein
MPKATRRGEAGFIEAAIPAISLWITVGPEGRARELRGAHGGDSGETFIQHLISTLDSGSRCGGPGDRHGPHLRLTGSSGHDPDLSILEDLYS